MRGATVTLVLIVLHAGCSKPPSSPSPSSPQEATHEGGSEGPAASEPGTGERPKLTRAACEKEGGKVVGDIGDGAIHRPEYRCPDSDRPPIGSIVAEPGGPVAIEGAVCCK